MSDLSEPSLTCKDSIEVPTVNHTVGITPQTLDPIEPTEPTRRARASEHAE